MDQYRPPAQPRSRQRPGIPPLLATIALLALVVLPAACTGSPASSGVATLVDPSASASAAPSASVDPEEAMLAFTTCMRNHGVDIKMGTSGSGGAGPVTIQGKPGDEAKMDAAQTACAPLLPKGGINAAGGTPDPEFQDKLLAYAKCMRDNGIDFPDPQFSSDGSGGTRVQIGSKEDSPKFDPESKTFKDAQAACESLMPGQLGGNSSPNGSDSGPSTDIQQ